MLRKVCKTTAAPCGAVICLRLAIFGVAQPRRHGGIPAGLRSAKSERALSDGFRSV